MAVREQAIIEILAEIGDTLGRFNEVGQRWQQTITKINAATDRAEIDDLERDAEGLARELVETGQKGAVAFGKLATKADAADTDVSQLRAEVNRLEGELRSADARIESFGKSGASSLGGLKGAILGIGVALAAIGAGRAFRAIIEATGVQDAAVAKLNATLAATQHAAGLTSAELQKIASDMQAVTTSGDETNLGLLSLLLTFKQIGGDILPEVLERTLDLAEAMGGDAKGAALQLGKALNDPVLGISALSRAGVSFTEDQKEVIKALVDTGDVAGAQRVILEELAGEFGGVARAARETLPGALAALKNAVGDLAERVGQAGLARELEIASDTLTGFATDSETATGAAAGLGQTLATLVRGASYVGVAYTTLRGVLADTWGIILGGLAKVADGSLAFADTIGGLIESLADKIPVVGSRIAEAARADREAIAALREGALTDLKFLAEGYRETAQEQYAASQAGIELIARIREEYAARAEATAGAAERGEALGAEADAVTDAAAKNDLLTASLKEVAAATDEATAAAARRQDVQVFGEGAEQAAEDAKSLAERAEKLRRTIAGLEGLPSRTAEQLGDLFAATDELAVVERDLTAAIAEAAPVYEVLHSQTEDTIESRQELLDSTRDLREAMREEVVGAGELAHGLAQAETSAQDYLDITEQLGLGTKDAAAAAKTLGTEVGTTELALADLTAEQAANADTLDAMKSRLDIAGQALGEWNEQQEQAVEATSNLNEAQKEQLEREKELTEAIESEALKRVAALQSVNAEVERYVTLCKEAKACTEDLAA